MKQTAMQAAYGITQTPKDFTWQNEQDEIAEREARKMLDTYAPGWQARQPLSSEVANANQAAA